MGLVFRINKKEPRHLDGTRAPFAGLNTADADKKLKVWDSRVCFWCQGSRLRVKGLGF